MNGWLVVRTHPGREKWACENIKRQGAESYMPMILEQVATKGQKVMRARCLFPNYVFVKSLNGRWRFLLGTFGVSSVLLFSGEPGTVSDAEIERMRSKEDKDGFVQLPSARTETRRFQQGDIVRVTGGHMEGRNGVWEGAGPHERQKVLLDFLGRKVSVLIPEQHLEGV